MDLPSEYGDDVTAWRRLRDWEKQGIWKTVLKRVMSLGYSSNRLILDKVSVDSTDVAAKKGGILLGMTDTRRLREARFTQL